MKKLLSIAILLSIFIVTTAQTPKRPLSFDDVLKWNTITEQRISNDGEYIVYKTQPAWRGDSKLFISTKNGKELATFDYATRSVITNDSKYVVFTIQPPADTIRQLKLKKTKKENMPKDKLAIYEIKSGKLDTIPNLKSFELPAEWSGWIAWQVEVVKSKKAKEQNKEGDDKTADKKKETKKKEKKESAKNGYALNIKNLKSGELIHFPFVTQYTFATKKEVLICISTGDDKDIGPGIYRFDLKSGDRTALITGKASYKQLSMNKEGSEIAFLADTSGEKTKKKDYRLYVWRGSGEALEVATNSTDGIPENWEISVNGRLSFSESGDRVFMGIAPVKPEKDTTILDEEKPKLDVWHWSEAVLHTQQLKNLSRDLKKTYMAVYHLDKKKLVLLQTKDINGLSLINKGDADEAIAWSNAPYAVQIMWEGGPAHNNFYLIDMLSGEKRLIKKNCRATPRVSTNSKYLYWYEAVDTTWHTYKLATDEEFVVATAASIPSADELNDRPNLAGSYGTAGWLKKDKALLIYDRYDIWRVDPENNTEPINLTLTGRSNKITYRIMNIDRKRFSENDKGLDVSKLQYLKAHNEITREEGYFSWTLKKPNEPKELLYGEFKLSTPYKAKDSDDVFYTKETFETFPDMLASNLKFKKETRISNANPQQDEFNWGTAEIVTWTSIDGRKLEGTLHKPANFDPSKKYPMIVNFYEKSSQGLFSHHTPGIGRSTIGYHYYTSHGYLIFNPDVYYKTGYPGEDALNCVMPGVTALIDKGFVDEKHVGAQGHSWGGYQVAYLATRTNLFAAIESGAPVVNMFSAYGGIRWGSGQNRSFQYEHTQSRIGKSIWESPLRYIENSPIFTADKIQTPILIMHNDDDGAVPWYQGIEFFIALRRMSKPAWLLNYNNADHWPTRMADRIDFQTRMAQFFDYYLKDQPMPKWMKEGVPAIEKDLKPKY